MAKIEKGLKYSPEHLWVDIQGDIARVGLTDYAQDQAGEIIFIELPEIGEEIVKSERIGELESTNTVVDLIAPLSGTVISINEDVEDTPSLINEDPYREGWILEIEYSDPSEIDELMDASEYEQYIREEEEEE